MRDATLTAIAAALLTAAATHAQTINPPSYRSLELPTLGGQTASPTDISNTGWIVGQSTTQSGFTLPFRYRNGVIQLLGSLPGLTHAGATAVNDAGDVVGTAASIATLGGATSQPWLWRNGQFTDLDPFNRGVEAAGRGINNAGTAAGWLGATTTGEIDAFTAVTGTTTLLPLPADDTCHISRAVDINNAGEVAGYAAPAGGCGDSQAWVFRAGAVQPLPGLGGRNATPSRINDAGDIVGRDTTPSGTTTATLWRLGTPIALTSPGTTSAAYDINAAGVIVGQYFRPSPQHPVATVWFDLVPFALSDLTIGGLSLDAATAINDAGAIVGYGLNANGRSRAFLLTPFCIGDYNSDGGIDNADVEAFFREWEGGNFNADLNGDGGIDGSDVQRFFERWEAGRC